MTCGTGSAAAAPVLTDARHAGTARTATLTGLTPDTTYEVQVRATNAMGTGAWSGPVQGRTRPLLSGVTGNIPIYYFPHLAVGNGWQNHDHLYQLLPTGCDLPNPFHFGPRKRTAGLVSETGNDRQPDGRATARRVGA